MSNDQPNNNPKPKMTQPTKKVFDVVRPGKSPASPTSRPVIMGHKPQVPDDQFVPGPNTRLAGDPSEKRPLMDPAKKKGIMPFSDGKGQSSDQPNEPAAQVADPAAEDPVTDVAEDHDAGAPLLPTKTEGPSPAPEAPEPFGPGKERTQAREDLLAPAQPDAPEETKDEEAPAAERPTPEQMAVGQSVDTQDLQKAQPAEVPQSDPKPPMTQDDVLADTDAPVLDRAVVSHHKHHTKLWEWLLISLLIVLLAAAALNFLLDAGVVTTELDIPHTDLFKD